MFCCYRFYYCVIYVWFTMGLNIYFALFVFINWTNIIISWFNLNRTSPSHVQLHQHAASHLVASRGLPFGNFNFPPQRQILLIWYSDTTCPCVQKYSPESRRCFLLTQLCSTNIILIFYQSTTLRTPPSPSLCLRCVVPLTEMSWYWHPLSLFRRWVP